MPIWRGSASLRPEEIDDVGVRPGAMGEPLFVLRENGREFPAVVLSAGTLRFAALAAAFFQPDMPDLIAIEEIENGIHANRARLVLELLRSQSAAAETQVVATTHSATVLDWLGEGDEDLDGRGGPDRGAVTGRLRRPR